MNRFSLQSKSIGQVIVAALILSAGYFQCTLAVLALPFIKRPAQTQAQIKAKEAAPVIREKWAVLVGLSHFQDAAIVPEPFSERAVMVLRSALYDPEFGKFAHDHVVTLTADQATKKAIVDALSESWLMTKALPNDLIVIYFCSKAVPNKAGNALVVCSYDTSLAAPDESGVVLHEVLNDLHRRTQCKNIVCLLDLSPATGDVSPPTDNLYPLPTNGLNPAIAGGSKPGPLARLSMVSNVSFLAANQILNPSYQSEHRKNSYFAYYLADSFRQPGGMQPLHDVSQFVAENVLNDVNHELHKQQMVELRLANDNPNLAALPLGIATGKSGTPLGSPRIGFQYDRIAMDRPDLMLGATPIAQAPPSKLGTSSSAGQDDDDDEPTQEVDMGPYLKHMKTAVQAKWQPPKGLEQKKVVVIFTILKDGTITDPEIAEPSGEASVDQSALQALKAASPLPPLPMGAPKTIRVKYKFEWKITRQQG
jgi:TonB family protein